MTADQAVTADPASFRRFHHETLPKRIEAGNGALAFADAEYLGSLGFRTDGGSFTYRAVDGTVQLTEGEADADTVVALDLAAWAGLASDLETAPGLFYTGRVEIPVGKPGRFVRWEPALRALFHGIPIYDPDTADLRDVAGQPLDLDTAFITEEIRDDNAAARHFLDTAGYLVVRDVFDDDEVRRMLDAVAAVERAATPGDQSSWWGVNTDGEEILTRSLNAASQHILRSLHHDPRVLCIADVPPEPLTAPATEGNHAVTVLWKRPNMVEGLADLPWHRDCGMGGHAANCPMTVMTVCLAGGDAAGGELRVLPGSHRSAYPFVDGTHTEAPRGHSLAVTAGDVTLHYGDIMHASMPPTSDEGPHRISLLMEFTPTSGGLHYDDALLGAEDGQIEHLGDKLGLG